MAPSGPVVIVTGCTAGGIGHAVSCEFAARGCHVFATARKIESMTGLKEAGCTLLPLDVTDAASIKGAVAQVLKAAGRIDVLVNMAGLSGRGAAAEYDLAQARRQFEVNLFGLMAMNQAVLPSMLQQGRGTIINVGSALGLLPVPFASVYCASKAAVRAMTDCMRMELAGSGVQVVYAAPGWVKSNIITTMAATGLNVLDSRGPWAPCARFITGNLYEVEAGHAWEPAAFAAHFCTMALSPRPPRLYLNSLQDGWLAWVTGSLCPSWLLDRILMAKYSLGAWLWAAWRGQQAQRGGAAVKRA